MRRHTKFSEKIKPENFSLTTHFPAPILQPSHAKHTGVTRAFWTFPCNTYAAQGFAPAMQLVTSKLLNRKKGRNMFEKKLKPLVYFILLIIILFFPNFLHSGQPENAPVIHMDITTHTFPTVFEGEKLSHDFIISNQGSADLEIEDVTHR